MLGASQELAGALSSFSIVRFVLKPSGLYGQPVLGGNTNTISLSLCNIHIDLSSSVHTLSTGAGFSLFFLFLCFYFLFLLLPLQQKNFWNFTNFTAPSQNLDSPQAADSPLKLLGKNSAKRKKQLSNCACSKLYWIDTGYTIMHTSSLHATATPNRD